VTTSEALGHVLRKTRIEKNLSQRQVAYAIGFSSKARTYISKLEGGICSPTLGSLERIASAYDVSGSALLRQAEELVRAVNNGEVPIPKSQKKNPEYVYAKTANIVDPAAIERRRKIAIGLGTLPMEVRAL
jgi:transcriptional regulator with XRE-family HTH domain